MRFIRIKTNTGKLYYTRELTTATDRLIFIDPFKDRSNNIELLNTSVSIIDSVVHDYARISKDDPDYGNHELTK